MEKLFRRYLANDSTSVTVHNLHYGFFTVRINSEREMAVHKREVSLDICYDGLELLCGYLASVLFNLSPLGTVRFSTNNVLKR